MENRAPAFRSAPAPRKIGARKKVAAAATLGSNWFIQPRIPWLVAEISAWSRRKFAELLNDKKKAAAGPATSGDEVRRRQKNSARDRARKSARSNPEICLMESLVFRLTELGKKPDYPAETSNVPW